ncbi:hypothetical protein D3C76_568310 [compost metagenome]
MQLLAFSTSDGQRFAAECRFIQFGGGAQQAPVDRYHLPQAHQQCLIGLDLFYGDLAQPARLLQPGKTWRPVDEGTKLTFGALAGKKLQGTSACEHQGNHRCHQCLRKGQGGGDRQQRDHVYTGLAPGQTPDDLDQQYQGHHHASCGPAHRRPVRSLPKVCNTPRQQRQGAEQEQRGIQPFTEHGGDFLEGQFTLSKQKRPRPIEVKLRSRLSIVSVLVDGQRPWPVTR